MNESDELVDAEEDLVFEGSRGERDVNRLRAVEGICIDKVLTEFLWLLNLICIFSFFVSLFFCSLLDLFVLLLSALFHLVVNGIFVHEEPVFF